ncbi:hypothetical protein LJR267_010416 [Paraburkholderia hospita]|uniref:hypothetical protein n=1 Tax=Paraburkholderia hospita TaxID=169430 RepID=UPI003ED1665C
MTAVFATRKKVVAAMLLVSFLQVSANPAWPVVYESTAKIADAQVRRAELDRVIVSLGIDPDSDKGMVLATWLPRLLRESPTDSQSRVGEVVDAGSEAQLAPGPRLQYTGLLKTLASGLTGDRCTKFSAALNDLRLLSATLAADELDQFLAIRNALREPQKAGVTAETYTVEELLEADSRLEMRIADLLAVNVGKAVQQSPNRAQPGEATCATLVVLFDSVLTTPEPFRTRISWELMQSNTSQRGTVLTQTLDDPESYAAENFGRYGLPPDTVRSLPAPGSVALPFRRIRIEGEWRFRKSSRKPVPYEAIYLNLFDDAIVTQIIRSGDGRQRRAHFAAWYGIVPLKEQELGTAFAVVPPRLTQIRDGDLRAAPIPEHDAVFDSPPLQQPERVTDRLRCHVHHRYSASSVYEALVGDAVDITCRASTRDGEQYERGSIYLYSYGVVIPLFRLDENGLAVAEIRDIAIER